MENEFYSGLQIMRSYIEYSQERNMCIEEEEKKAFTVNGVILTTEEQMKREVRKLLSILAHDADFEYEKYSKMLSVIKSLMEAIKQIQVLQEVLKRVIVHMCLEMGIISSFYTTFVDMEQKYILEEFCCDKNLDNFTLEWLCLQYA